MNRFVTIILPIILLMGCVFTKKSQVKNCKCKLVIKNLDSPILLNGKTFNRIQYSNESVILSDAYWCLFQDSLWMIPLIEGRIEKDSSWVLFAVLVKKEFFYLKQNVSNRTHLGYIFVGNTSETDDLNVFNVQHLIFNDDGMVDKNHFPFNQQFDFLINKDGHIVCSVDLNSWNMIFQQYW